MAWLGLISITLLIATVPQPYRVRRLGSSQAVLSGAVGLAGTLAFLSTFQLDGALVATLIAGLFIGSVRLAMPRLSAAGVLEMSVPPLTLLFTLPWGFFLLKEQGFPPWALGVFAAGGTVAAVMAPFAFATRLANEAAVTHRRWRRPTAAPPEPIKIGGPKVSIHVPCYAEPPEVVIATLRRLAALRYPNFEVIVCDNNTPDEALWRPVERFCAELNARGSRAPFRFFHVAPLQGAKAGALNFSLTHTAPDVELVAVIDADYLAEPDFLSRLTGFFADPEVGFVQTPHDYRPDGSVYQDMCYWEYMPPNKVGIASINEYDCAYTIGTMCILRKDAIEQAGGWAEWCLTEDSEISIRIRALGYQGIFVNETFGRGLIPETYEDYKKQRFRWTAGPVQQLLAHWRLFLPAWAGNKAPIDSWAKLMEVNRSISPLVGVVAVVSAAAAFVGSSWMTVLGWLPQISFPPVFWVCATAGVIGGLARTWQRYRLTGVTEPARILGAEIASLSLLLVKVTAALAPLSGRPMKWRRTPKFAAQSSVLRALTSTAPEVTVGLVLALLAYLPVHHHAELGGHVTLLALIGAIGGAVAFLSAPLMAFQSEARLRRQAEAEAEAWPAIDAVAADGERLSRVA